MQLHDIHQGTSLQGLEPDLIVTVVAVVPLGPDSATLYYKLPDGSLRERLVGPAELESVSVATVERPWAFDGDGERSSSPRKPSASTSRTSSIR